MSTCLGQMVLRQGTLMAESYCFSQHHPFRLARGCSLPKKAWQPLSQPFPDRSSLAPVLAMAQGQGLGISQKPPFLVIPALALFRSFQVCFPYFKAPSVGKRCLHWPLPNALRGIPFYSSLVAVQGSVGRLGPQRMSSRKRKTMGNGAE